MHTLVVYLILLGLYAWSLSEFIKWVESVRSLLGDAKCTEMEMFIFIFNTSTCNFTRKWQSDKMIAKESTLIKRNLYYIFVGLVFRYLWFMEGIQCHRNSKE